jgi:DNA invertase Pin-like site-specific DNA recombinase
MKSNKIYGYVRVSTTTQETTNQELEITRYARKKDFRLDEVFSFVVSSRKSKDERGLNKLLELVNEGDILIFTELSRLGRSTVEVISILRELGDKGVIVHLIKQNMIIDKNGVDPFQKMLITMLASFDELSRDIISLRVTEGLKGAKERGRVGGRRKGQTVAKKLDGKEQEIKELLELGVSKGKIAEKFGVSRPTLNRFIDNSLVR